MMLAATCVLALVSPSPACWAQEAGSNVLANPSFEEGQGAPTAWAFNARKTASEITWDRARAHAGEASVRITNHTQAQTGNVLQTVRFDPPLPVGSRVGFSARAAAQDVAGGSPSIILQLYSTANARQNASASCRGGTHEFVEVRGQTVIERPTNRITIYLCNYAVGAVWWDDAVMTIERARPVRILPRPEKTRPMPALRTDDGLGLILNDSGGVDRVLVDGKDVAKAGVRSGLWLRPFGGDTAPVAGTVTAKGQSVTQDFRDEELGLRAQATFSSGGSCVECAGVVEDLTGEDRGVDVLFALPVVGAGWRWGKSIREEVAIGEEPQVVQVTTFSSVSNPETGEGLCLAVPADAPCDCEFTYNAEFGYAVRFRFGLSPAAGGELRSRAPFRFVLYRCDGRWGLRDAARRYYELFPEAFAKRVKREGLWMFGAPRFDLPDPENYAFHEGGPKGWEYDDEHDICTCPYIIPGQREVTRLESLPGSKQEAMHVFKAFEPTDPDRPGGWGAGIKEIIANCMLHDAQGLPHVRIRNTPWGGNSITFPLNANPRLFGGTDKVTIAKVLLGHVADMQEQTPNLDGVYVDSLGAWGSYRNHRREHFGYAQVPLSYDPGNGRPVIANRFALLEFLWALRDYLHERDKLLFANGVHQNRRFHFFALDVMGVEGHGWLEQKRAMAYQKPFLLLIYNIHDDPEKMEYWFHRCTLYGIYPSFANMRVYKTAEMYAPVAALNNRFVPVLRRITGAGWHPITFARSSDEDVWLERWGPDGEGNVYFTAYNASSEDREVALSVETGELGLEGASVVAEDLLSKEKWEAPIKGGRAVMELAMPAEKVRVLRLGGP